MDLSSQNWLQAQYSVLGSVLISPEVIPAVIQGTRETDYSGPCRTIFGAVRDLFRDGVPVDPVSVNAKLGGSYTEFLVQLMEVTPSAANIQQYITLCREQAQLSGLRELAAQMAQEDNPDKLRQLMAKSAELMVNKSRVRITTMEQAINNFYTVQQQPTNYLSWPISALNGVLFAEPGDFIVMGGLPSAGKTAFALQCMWHFVRRQKCGFFSLETTSAKLFARQISGAAGIPMGDIKNHTLSRDAWDTLGQMYQQIAATNCELIDAAGFTVDDIRAVTIQQGYQVIFIDYLQLIQAAGVGRVEQVTAISLGLHTLAQSLGVTVVALSQLSRTPKDRREKLPDLSSLRESGQIEQDADIVLLLSLENPANRDGPRILQVAKNKEGTRPDMMLEFDGKTQTFSKARKPGAMGQYIAAGKRARANGSGYAQLTMLPADTPVPFEEEAPDE